MIKALSWMIEVAEGLKHQRPTVKGGCQGSTVLTDGRWTKKVGHQ